MARKPRTDELEVYRTLLEQPTEFKNGFTWTTVAGALFCGLLMMPGAIYLSLVTGGTITAAWVTLIIFSEVSRRAMKSLNTQELVVLLYVAGAMSIGGPFAALIYRQYFITSDAVRDAGLLGAFPGWWAPQPTSDAILSRNLMHPDWFIPIVIIVVFTILGRIANYTLGYFFFRLTSDIERLPFPFAPIGAQGSMALAESGEKTQTWKWKVFSIGAALGLAFAVIQIGLPMITGSVMAKPITLIPLPWFDATTITESVMPATATGIVLDLGLVLMGMVIPFWAVLGSMAAMILTLVLNPILHGAGILTRWQPGMDTVATTFVNSIDFWMSFGLGVAGGIAVISIYQTVRDVVKKAKEAKKRREEMPGDRFTGENVWETPEGRGDFSPWLALVIYGVCATIMVWICHTLVPSFPTLFLIFFTFLYTPFISYINAKIIGICGQHVEIPFIREGAYILSGFKGVEIWLAPIPVENYGMQAQNFRVTELTGTNFRSYIYADLLIVPLSLILSFVFWTFIWQAGAIPSANFPFAQKMWDLQAKQQILLWSSTMATGGAKPLFFQALHPAYIFSGLGFTVGTFGILTAFGLPIIAVFGFVQAIGGMPHAFIPQIIGAFIGKFYFHKRFGQRKFLQMAPVLVAGYGTGVGLIALIGVAFNLIVKAISPAPF